MNTELIDARQPIILAIDNGGTNTRVARGGHRLGRMVPYETPQNYGHAIDQIAATAKDVLGGKRPDAIGFSVAGAVREGRIVQAGQLDEYGWVGKPFAADVAEATGVPVDHIVLLNDCAAGANAERIARLEKNQLATNLVVPTLEVPALQLQEGEVGAFMVLSTGFGGSTYTETEL